MEVAGRTPPHEYEGCSRVGYTVKPVVVKKLFIHRSNRRENRPPCFPPFMIRTDSFRIPSSSLFLYIDTITQMRETGKTHGSPDNAVWFTQVLGHRVTFLDISSSFQTPLSAVVALEFHDYKPFLAFSMTYNTLGKLRTPLAFQLHVLSVNRNDNTYFAHSQGSCEDPLRKLMRRKSCETIKPKGKAVRQ